MRSIIAISIIVLLAILVIGGGIFFGLYSCGGYMWHKQLHMSLMVIVAIGVLLLSSTFLGAIWKRGLFITASFAIFIVIRSLTSAFYPVAPESMAKFIESFIKGVQYGPC